MSAATHFLYMIHPPRPSFVHDASADETATMRLHFEYLKGLSERDKLMLAGPCLDEGGFGVGILNTTDPDEARALADADPAVASGLMRPELHPVRLSFIK